MSYAPLRVTARLASPIGSDPPQLDALLLQRIYRLANIGGLPDGAPAPSVREQFGVGRFPLRWELCGGHPVACCSAPIMGPVMHDTHSHYTTRFPSEHVALLAPDNRGTVHTGSGTNKSYMLPLRTRQVEAVAWLCSGDRKSVANLLRGIKAIGKKASQGFGRVFTWDVERTDVVAWWYADSPDGPVLMRSLPNCEELPDDLIGFRRDYGACQPPYWHADRFMEIVSLC